jgi:hypothetical protein
MDEIVKKPCKDCGRDIDITAERCPFCNCLLAYQPCVVCGSGIRKGANYCNTCKSYQDIRQHFGVSTTFLSILTTLIAVLTPAIHAYVDYLNRHSNTTVVVKDVDETGVYVQFRNSGGAFSQISKAQLIFDPSVPLMPADLQQAEIGNTLIRPKEPLSAVLRLTAGLRRTRTDVSDEDILKLIREKRVKLRCVIAESNDPNHRLPDVDLVSDTGTHDLISKGLRHV